MTQHKTFCATWALRKVMPDESEPLIVLSPEQRQELWDSLDRSLAEALRLQQQAQASAPGRRISRGKVNK